MNGFHYKFHHRSLQVIETCNVKMRLVRQKESMTYLIQDCWFNFFRTPDRRNQHQRHGYLAPGAKWQAINSADMNSSI